MRGRAFDAAAWARVRAALAGPDPAEAAAREQEALQSRARELARPLAAPEALDARDVLRFGRGAESLAIELRYVLAVSRAPAITPVFGLPAHWAGVFAHRGEVVAVVDPARLFGMAAPAPEAPRLIVLGDVDAELALLVDEAYDLVSVRAAELRPPPRVADGPPLAGITAGGLAVLDGERLLADPRLFVGPTSAPREEA